MAAQTRTTAVFRLVNLFAGTTPGRAFQISTSRAAGHCSANLASSCERRNRSARRMEIDPVVVRRWQDYTGKKATLEGGGRTFEGIAGTASGPKCRTARRSRRRAGRTRGGRVLSAERIDARAILAFGGIYSQAHLLAERAGKEAAHAMGLPTGGSHQFQKRRSTFTAQQRQNIGLLAAFAAWGRLLLRAGLLARFGSFRPHTRRLCASLRRQVLNGRPDSDHSRFPARESFRRDNARQSVPDIHKPRSRPLLG